MGHGFELSQRNEILTKFFSIKRNRFIPWERDFHDFRFILSPYWPKKASVYQYTMKAFRITQEPIPNALESRFRTNGTKESASPLEILYSNGRYEKNLSNA